jgi:hypothetical protein
MKLAGRIIVFLIAVLMTMPVCLLAMSSLDAIKEARGSALGLDVFSTLMAWMLAFYIWTGLLFKTLKKVSRSHGGDGPFDLQAHSKFLFSFLSGHLPTAKPRR